MENVVFRIYLKDKVDRSLADFIGFRELRQKKKKDDSGFFVDNLDRC